MLILSSAVPTVLGLVLSLCVKWPALTGLNIVFFCLIASG